MGSIVIDNNVLFSIMNPTSTASYIFSLMKSDIFAPEFLKEELIKHKKECLNKSRLSEHEFELRYNEICSSIKFFKVSEYKKFLKSAKKALSDPDDLDFLALAHATRSIIWSNDKHLMQQKFVKVLTTRELILNIFGYCI